MLAVEVLAEAVALLAAAIEVLAAAIEVLARLGIASSSPCRPAPDERVSDSELPVSDSALPVSDSELPVSDSALPAALHRTAQQDRLGTVA